jgi:murein DD-endopeptidase MepM/ murein hydrolase activator NlpD
MLIAVVALFSVAGLVVLLDNRSASATVPAKLVEAVSAPMTGAQTTGPSPICSPTYPTPMRLDIAFTSSVTDTSDLHLHLPWGRPGDPMGRMVEDYGAYNGTSVREHLAVYDVTSGRLQVLYGHNAIDIVLESGTPLYAVTSGTVYHLRNWTIPGEAQGWAAVLVSDKIRDDSGNAVAFLYGHVREFDTGNGQRVESGALIARSGGGNSDPGRGFSDMPNVHFEVIESPNPLAGGAGTVNPHQFLDNLYAYAATPASSACAKTR